MLFLVPVGLILAYSFFRRSPTGGVTYTFTVDNYVRAVDPLFLKVLLFSVRTALLTTLIALVLGYAVAYFIATRLGAVAHAVAGARRAALLDEPVDPHVRVDRAARQ